MTLPIALQVEKNKLVQGAWRWLIDIETIGAVHYRITDSAEDVSFGGNTYTAHPAIQIGLAQASDSGRLQTMAIVLSRVGFAYQSIIRSESGLRGASVTLIYVNLDNLSEDYTETTTTWEVQYCRNEYWNIVLLLGVPGSLKHRIPEDRFLSLQCRHDFRLPDGSFGARCNYAAKSVASVTLPSGNPVNIEVTGHLFLTGDSVRLAAIAGITPSLAGDWTVTKVDANNFTLDDTDGDDYSGSYTGGGNAGHTYCTKLFGDCINRQRTANYGNMAAFRSASARIIYI